MEDGGDGCAAVMIVCARVFCAAQPDVGRDPEGLAQVLYSSTSHYQYLYSIIQHCTGGAVGNTFRGESEGGKSVNEYRIESYGIYCLSPG